MTNGDESKENRKNYSSGQARTISIGREPIFDQVWMAVVGVANGLRDVIVVGHFEMESDRENVSDLLWRN